MRKVLGIILVLGIFTLVACAGTPPPSCNNPFVDVPPVVAAPAPAPAPRVIAPPPAVVRVAPAPIVIYFDFDKANIKGSETAKIDMAAKLLKDDPTAIAILEGNTDPIGADAYNMKLGDKRAAAVKKALVAKGVSASRLSTVSFGETNLVKAGVKTIAGNAANRRTVVVIKIK